MANSKGARFALLFAMDALLGSSAVRDRYDADTFLDVTQSGAANEIQAGETTPIPQARERRFGEATERARLEAEQKLPKDAGDHARPAGAQGSVRHAHLRNDDEAKNEPVEEPPQGPQRDPKDVLEERMKRQSEDLKRAAEELVKEGEPEHWQRLAEEIERAQDIGVDQAALDLARAAFAKGARGALLHAVGLNHVDEVGWKTPRVEDINKLLEALQTAETAGVTAGKELETARTTLAAIQEPALTALESAAEGDSAALLDDLIHTCELVGLGDGRALSTAKEKLLKMMKARSVNRIKAKPSVRMFSIGEKVKVEDYEVDHLGYHKTSWLEGDVYFVLDSEVWVQYETQLWSQKKMKRKMLPSSSPKLMPPAQAQQRPQKYHSPFFSYKVPVLLDWLQKPKPTE